MRVALPWPVGFVSEVLQQISYKSVTAIDCAQENHPQTSQFCLSFPAETQPHWTYQQHATKPFRTLQISSQEKVKRLHNKNTRENLQYPLMIPSPQITWHNVWLNYTCSNLLCCLVTKYFMSGLKCYPKMLTLGYGLFENMTFL